MRRSVHAWVANHSSANSCSRDVPERGDHTLRDSWEFRVHIALELCCLWWLNPLVGCCFFPSEGSLWLWGKSFKLILVARMSFSWYAGIYLQESIVTPLCPSYQIEIFHSGLRRPSASSLAFPFPFHQGLSRVFPNYPFHLSQVSGAPYPQKATSLM